MQTPSLNIVSLNIHAFQGTDMFQSFEDEPALDLESILKVMLEQFGCLRTPLNRTSHDVRRLLRGPFEVVVAPGQNAATDIDAVVMYVDVALGKYPLLTFQLSKETRKLHIRVIEHYALKQESAILTCSFDLLDLLVRKAKAYTDQTHPNFHWDI